MRVSNLGYAYSSFVGDMSTGFSGNLGFKMPSNWAFDQFVTTTIGSGNGEIEIDNFTEWTPSQSGTYDFLAFVTDATGKRISYRTQFVVS